MRDQEGDYTEEVRVNEQHGNVTMDNVQMSTGGRWKCKMPVNGTMAWVKKSVELKVHG